MNERYDSKIEEEGVLEYSEYQEEESEFLKKLERINTLYEETKNSLEKIKKQAEDLSLILKIGKEREKFLASKDKSFLAQLLAEAEQDMEEAQKIITTLEKYKSDLEAGVQTLRNLRVTAEGILEHMPKDTMH